MNRIDRFLGEKNMWILDVLKETLAAVVGGVILAVLLFWLKERFFPLPNVNGPWFVETKTEVTAMDSFKGMLLKHELVLWQEGAVLRGTSEKIYEASTHGRRQIEGSNRQRGELSGYITKYYFSKDRVRIHIVEHGEERDSTLFFDFLVDKKKMKGSFTTTVASSCGEAICSQNRYDKEFSENVQNEISDKYGSIARLEAGPHLNV